MEELPARKEEVEHAQHEGVQFKILTAPVRVIGNKEGWVEGLECLEMELGEPDASGRRRRSSTVTMRGRNSFCPGRRGSAKAVP